MSLWTPSKRVAHRHASRQSELTGEAWVVFRRYDVYAALPGAAPERWRDPRLAEEARYEHGKLVEHDHAGD